MKISLILLFLLSGCASSQAWTSYGSPPSKSGIYRFENEEVVCYSLKDTTSNSLQCLFKPEYHRQAK